MTVRSAGRLSSEPMSAASWRVTSRDRPGGRSGRVPPSRPAARSRRSCSIVAVAVGMTEASSPISSACCLHVADGDAASRLERSGWRSSERPASNRVCRSAVPDRFRSARVWKSSPIGTAADDRTRLEPAERRVEEPGLWRPGLRSDEGHASRLGIVRASRSRARPDRRAAAGRAAQSSPNRSDAPRGRCRPEGPRPRSRRCETVPTACRAIARSSGCRSRPSSGWWPADTICLTPSAASAARPRVPTGVVAT